MILWEDLVAGVSAELISRLSPTLKEIELWTLVSLHSQAGHQGMLLIGAVLENFVAMKG